MTKKDYVKFAEMLKDVRSNAHHEQSTTDVIINTIAFDICYILAADNPNFDRSRFLSACEVES